MLVVLGYNVLGMGASVFLKSFSSSLLKSDVVFVNKKIQIESEAFVKSYEYKRLYRLIELLLGFAFYGKWRNKVKIVLGDLPYVFMKNQSVFLHNPNILLSNSVKNRLYRNYWRFTHRFVSHIYVQTEYMKQGLNKEYPKFKGEIHVVYMPVSIPRVNAKRLIQGDEFYIYPTAYYRHKDVERLITIWEERGNDILILPMNRSEVRHQSIRGNIKFIGNQKHEHLIELIKGAKAVVWASRRESFGIGIVEAMCLGKPLLIIDKSYSRELCGDKAFYFHWENFHETFQLLKQSPQSVICYSSELAKIPNDWKEIQLDMRTRI